MRRRATRVGDIVEVKTPKGLAYLQYTHDRKGMGELVRILPGLFAVRPADFAQLANQRELYFVFYTLRHALKKRLVEVASHQPIPEWVRQYPLMRWPARSQGGIIGWENIQRCRRSHSRVASTYPSHSHSLTATRGTVNSPAMAAPCYG